MNEGILVGDVGGTNVRFAIAHRQGGRIVASYFEKFAGDDFGAFAEVLGAYLDRTRARVTQACFALAGPVQHGEVTLTNRGWHVSEQQLQQQFGFDDVRLINDFTAMARAVPEFERTSFESILTGTAEPGAPVIVAGAGTGFGVATLIPEAGNWHVLAGEGGHMAFAPRTKIEFQLAEILLQKFGYVSNELVSSGTGLAPVHEAFCEIFDRPVEDLSPAEMRARADAGDEMYYQLILVRACTVMGAAGDLALANGAAGGVVLAGGVTERIVDFLRTPEAMERFRERGPMSAYLENCPVVLMQDPQAPLIGAAAYYEQELRK
ncbi:glucokinase [Hyphomonas sp.]|uniref:glucokinase n=1 Tax=Hyphomonas sp. TaxID=87 RepID=UPI00352739AD